MTCRVGIIIGIVCASSYFQQGSASNHYVFQASYNTKNVSASVSLSTRIRCGNAGLGYWYAAVVIASDSSCVRYRFHAIGSIPPDADVLYKTTDVKIFTPSKFVKGNVIHVQGVPFQIKCGSTLAAELDLLESSEKLILTLHEGSTITQLSDTTMHRPFQATANRLSGKVVLEKYEPDFGWGHMMTYSWSPPSSVRLRFQIFINTNGAELTIESQEGVTTFHYPEPIECDRVNKFLFGSINAPMVVHKIFYEST